MEVLEVIWRIWGEASSLLLRCDYFDDDLFDDDDFCDYDVLDEFCDDLDENFCDVFWSLITIDQVLCVISLLALVVVHTALKGGGKTMFFVVIVMLIVIIVIVIVIFCHSFD